MPPDCQALIGVVLPAGISSIRSAIRVKHIACDIRNHTPGIAEPGHEGQRTGCSGGQLIKVSRAMIHDKYVSRRICGESLRVPQSIDGQLHPSV